MLPDMLVCRSTRRSTWRGITFATTVTLTQGVPLETVSKMLGHKHITTTQIYAKITNDKIGQDMAALSEKLNSVFKVAQ